MIGVLVVTMLQFLGRLPNNPLGINNWALTLSIDVLRFLPHFSMIWGLSNIHYNGALKKTCESVHSDKLTTQFICYPDESFADALAFMSKCCSGKPTCENDKEDNTESHLKNRSEHLFPPLRKETWNSLPPQSARTGTAQVCATIGLRHSPWTMRVPDGKWFAWP